MGPSCLEYYCRTSDTFAEFSKFMLAGFANKFVDFNSFFHNFFNCWKFRGNFFYFFRAFIKQFPRSQVGFMLLN